MGTLTLLMPWKSLKMLPLTVLCCFLMLRKGLDATYRETRNYPIKNNVERSLKELSRSLKDKSFNNLIHDSIQEKLQYINEHPIVFDKGNLDKASRFPSTVLHHESFKEVENGIEYRIKSGSLTELIALSKILEQESGNNSISPDTMQYIKTLVSLKGLIAIQGPLSNSENLDPQESIKRAKEVLFGRGIGSSHEGETASNSNGEEETLPLEMRFAVSPYVISSNPIVQGRIITTYLAAMKYDHYFKAGVYPYHSWEAILRESPEDRYSMVGAMCGINTGSAYHKGQYVPRYKRELIELKRNFLFDYDDPLHLACEMLNSLLHNLEQIEKKYLLFLERFGGLVELNAGAAKNARRLYHTFCDGQTDRGFRCSFEDSRLKKLVENLQSDSASKIMQEAGEAFLYLTAISGDVRAYADVLADGSLFAESVKTSLEIETDIIIKGAKGSGNSQSLKGFMEKELKRCVRFKEKTLLNPNVLSKLELPIDAYILPNFRSWVTRKHHCNHKVKELIFFLLKTPGQNDVTYFSKIEKFLRLADAKYKAKTISDLFSKVEAGDLIRNNLLLMPYLSLLQAVIHKDLRRYFRDQSENVADTINKRGSKGPSIVSAIKRKILSQAKKNEKLVAVLEAGIPPHNLELLKFGAYTFATHSLPLLHLNQLAYVQRDPDLRTQETLATIGQLDKQIKAWSEKGITPQLLKMMNQNDSLLPSDLQGIRLSSMETPSMERWNHHLLAIVQRHLNILSEAHLFQTSSRDPCQGGRGAITQLIADDAIRMRQTSGESTVLMGSIIRGGRARNIGGQAFRKGKNYLKAALTRGGLHPSRHAVWYALNLDMNSIFLFFNSLLDVFAKNKKYFKEKTDLAKAFEALVRKKQKEFYSYKGIPPMVPQKTLFVSLDPSYGCMSEKERSQEHFRSMQAMHLHEIWKVLYVAFMPNLLDAKRMNELENTFSKNSWQRSLVDPLAQNSLRMLLKGDITMIYLDRILPKSMKNQLKEMKDGKATWFTFAMMISGMAHNKLGNSGMGSTLVAQAPFMGNTVKEWQEFRKKKRKMEIFGYIGLIGMTASALYIYTGLVEHAVAAGEHSATEFSNALVQECLGCGQLCICGPTSSNLNPTPTIEPNYSPTGIAFHDLVKVLMLGSVAGNLWFVSAGYSMWLILSSKIKVLSRIEFMLTKNTIPKLLQKLKRSKFGNWAKRKTNLKAVKEGLRTITNTAKLKAQGAQRAS